MLADRRGDLGSDRALVKCLRAVPRDRPQGLCQRRLALARADRRRPCRRRDSGASRPRRRARRPPAWPSPSRRADGSGSLASASRMASAKTASNGSVPRRPSSVSHALIAPGTVTACGPLSGISRKAIAAIPVGIDAGRRAARTVQPMHGAVRLDDDGEAVAADPGHLRLDDRQRRRCRHRRIDGVAAALQYVDGRQRRQRMRGRRHAVLGIDGRAARTIETAHLFSSVSCGRGHRWRYLVGRELGEPLIVPIHCARLLQKDIIP